MRSALLLASVVSVAAFAVVGFRYVTSVHEPEESFVAEQWVTRRAQLQLNDPGCVRGAMALSLIRTGALLKLTRVEVVGLLGAPRSCRGNTALWPRPMPLGLAAKPAGGQFQSWRQRKPCHGCSRLTAA